MCNLRHTGSKSEVLVANKADAACAIKMPKIFEFCELPLKEEYWRKV